jgi:hypothetical protein
MQMNARLHFLRFGGRLTLKVKGGEPMNQHGNTMVEYALVTGMIATIIIAFFGLAFFAG